MFLCILRQKIIINDNFTVYYQNTYKYIHKYVNMSGSLT